MKPLYILIAALFFFSSCTTYKVLSARVEAVNDLGDGKKEVWIKSEKGKRMTAILDTFVIKPQETIFLKYRNCKEAFKPIR